MALKQDAYKQKIKKKGHWNYADTYNFCFDWLKDNGYFVSEQEYTEKISGGGKEIEIKWVARKKVTDYFKNVIELKWHILGMKDAEIERDGVKESTNKGELKIEFKAVLEKDYENRWEDKPFYKFMRGTYEKYIIRTTIDEYEDRLVDDTRDMIADLKGFLELEGK